MFHPVTNYTSAQFTIPTATLDGWNDSKHLTVQSTAAFTIQQTGAVNLTPNLFMVLYGFMIRRVVIRDESFT